MGPPPGTGRSSYMARPRAKNRRADGGGPAGIGGFTVSFAGGGVANDEVLARAGREPDVLLMFSMPRATCRASGNSSTRSARSGASRRCAGWRSVAGVQPAEGPAEEIGADVWAGSPLKLGALSSVRNVRATSTQRTVGRSKRPRPNRLSRHGRLSPNEQQTNTRTMARRGANLPAGHVFSGRLRSVKRDLRRRADRWRRRGIRGWGTSVRAEPSIRWR